jgi:D-alanyl-D-alanine carboxypeptidase
MALDANAGTVLHNQAGDELRHPASLTKMMTLYMTFELIELGRLSYASKITMTEEAAAAAPSKLGLTAGEEIDVLDAIKALITKSANDVAIALAQHIGGSEQNFARLMTLKAREIGMTKTTFTNASGLPDPQQVTTARDMLTLALKLQDEFPRHYQLFATRTFTYGGRTYRNHNVLLGRYAGTDGIKTGYTRDSGFNLVASVHRDGKHVVAAVFGGKTARARNAKMLSVLNRALAQASTKRTRNAVPVARAEPPVLVRSPAPVQAADRTAPPSPSHAGSSGVSASAAPQPDEEAPSIAVAKVRRVLIGPDLHSHPSPSSGTAADQPVFAVAGAAFPSESSSGGPAAAGREPEPPPPASPGEDALPRFVPASDVLLSPSAESAQPSQPTGSPPSTLEAQAEALTRGDKAAADAAAQSEPQKRVAAREARGAFEIQIGAYSNTVEAERNLTAARQRAGGRLDPYEAVAVPLQSGASQLYRARFRGFDATAAASACLHLRRLQIDCFVVNTQ